MRYFYHYGEHMTRSSRVSLTSDNFCTSNALIEIDKEAYENIVKDEEVIMEKNPNIKGWHFPIACEEIPEGKFIYNKIVFTKITK